VASTLVGSTLGRFRVDRLLGKGGMGEVYAAFDERLEREVALKVLSEEGDVAVQKKRLMREAKLAAKLTHPNIATVYEVDELEGRLCIVMELLQGSSLRKILTTRKMDMDESIAVGRDIARALARAHSGGVIHRDIKPENVFVTSLTPDALLAKVLDFGLARHRPEGLAVSEQTLTTTRGDMWGTPGYVSPEQAHGQEIDVRTDIFSFGVILYEMLAGIRPFRADTPLGVMIATTRNEPRPLREIVPHVPPAIEELVRCCLRKDRESRYADGSALSAALESFVRANPTSYALPSAIGATPAGPVLAVEDVGGNMIVSQALAPAPDSRRAERLREAPTFVQPGRDARVPPDEQQRREHMKLIVAIVSGVGTALVLVVLLFGWLSSLRRVHTTASAAPSASVFELAEALSSGEPPLVPSALPPPSAAALGTEAPAPAPSPMPSMELLGDPLDGPDPAPSAAPAPPRPVVAPRAAPAGAGASSARPRRKPADCAEPFKVDSKGVKIPKLYCL
jgi:serine/threonine-protein kinase